MVILNRPGETPVRGGGRRRDPPVQGPVTPACSGMCSGLMTVVAVSALVRWSSALGGHFNDSMTSLSTPLCFQNKWPWPLFRGRIKVTSTITSHSSLNMKRLCSNGPPIGNGLWVSNVHVIY